MAKTHGKTLQSSYSKPTFSRFLSCFGSFCRKTYIENIPELESDRSKEKSRRRRWISWRRIRIMKNSATKTVPIEASVSDEKIQTKRRASKLHSTKSKLMSSLHEDGHSSPDTQIPPPNLAPPAYTPPPPPPQVGPVEPSQTPPLGSNGHPPEQNVSGELEHREHSNRVESHEDDTRQQSSSSPSRTFPALSHSRSASKGQVRNSPSFVRKQTTSKQHERAETTMRSFDPWVGMSVIVVTLMIMILCGRLCAVLCLSAWLYVVSRFRTKAQKDSKKLKPNSNDLDLDSMDYKKRVVLEGLLERKEHRVTATAS